MPAAVVLKMTAALPQRPGLGNKPPEERRQPPGAVVGHWRRPGGDHAGWPLSTHCRKTRSTARC